MTKYIFFGALVVVAGCSSTVHISDKESSDAGSDVNTGGNINAGSGGAAGSMGKDSGNSGGNSIGGSTGGTNQCIPYDCSDLESDSNAESCGLLDDGCGNYINCGACSNEQERCGGFRQETHGLLTDPQDNICAPICYNFGSADGQINDAGAFITCKIGCTQDLINYTNCEFTFKDENGNKLWYYKCLCEDWINE